MFNLNADTGFNRFLARLTDLFFLQFLFFLTSIPIITMGASLCAMFSTCRKLQQDTVSGVSDCYFSDFRCHFRRSTGAWLLFLLCAVMFWADINYYSGSTPLDAVCRLLAVFLSAAGVLISVYLFPMIAWLEYPLFPQMKNALILSILHLGTTIYVMLLYLGGYLAARWLLPIFLLVGISGPVYLATAALVKALAPVAPELIVPELPAEEEQE